MRIATLLNTTPERRLHMQQAVDLWELGHVEALDVQPLPASRLAGLADAKAE
ncbi:MAG: hypothetical protein V4633_17125 [Pseudomonadota bacterium]